MFLECAFSWIKQRENPPSKKKKKKRTFLEVIKEKGRKDGRSVVSWMVGRSGEEGHAARIGLT
jgi:hypothetical protein